MVFLISLMGLTSFAGILVCIVQLIYVRIKKKEKASKIPLVVCCIIFVGALSVPLEKYDKDPKPETQLSATEESALQKESLAPNTEIFSTTTPTIAPLPSANQNILTEDIKLGLKGAVTKNIENASVDFSEKSDSISVNATIPGLGNVASLSMERNGEAIRIWNTYRQKIDGVAGDINTAVESLNLDKPVLVYFLSDLDNQIILATIMNGKVAFDVVENAPKPTEEPVEPEETKRPSPKPESNDSNEEYVYVTSKGKKYHSNSSCSDMNNPGEITISEAIDRGYTACSKCY